MAKRKVKAIAFDLIGVLAKEKEIPLTPEEMILEAQFGKLNFDHLFYAWAVQQLNTSKEDITRTVQSLVLRLYELKDPEILPRVAAELPLVKLAIASNHLSTIEMWIDEQRIRRYFHTIVISSLVDAEKPDPRFFEILVKGLEVEPDETLFVDDSEANISGAKKYGLLTLHYTPTSDLLTEIKRLMPEE